MYFRDKNLIRSKEDLRLKLLIVTPKCELPSHFLRGVYAKDIEAIFYHRACGVCKL
jgi:hypothetical protein